MYILCLLILDKIVEVYKLTNDDIKFGWFYKLYILFIFLCKGVQNVQAFNWYKSPLQPPLMSAGSC